jgi:CRISPR-associated protein Csb2
MLIIELSFLNGRFHATPWGRNVNEGVPEWPPSPYRLVRAIYDVWKRKRPEWPASRVEPLLAALASEPPSFSLPPATASHTKAFLSQNSKDITERQPIFDAFVLMEKGSKVMIAWPNVDLGTAEKADLNELLSLINYVGRSESWVSAKTIPKAEGTSWNCTPAAISNPKDGEAVAVACPVSVQEYSAQPFTLAQTSRKVKSRTLSWMEAMAWSTSEMLNCRLSEPPAFRYQTYIRPDHCFDLEPIPHMTARGPAVNGVLYAIESKVMPCVTSTLEISERFRRKLMGIHKKISGDPRKVSQKFSGKNTDGNPLQGHRHLYILPQDQDGDGILDHILAVCKEPLDLEEQLALDRMTFIRQPDGKPDIRMIPVQWGKIGDLKGTEPRTCFTSATPFLPPRHYRKGRGDFMKWITGEVSKEAENHCLPKPISITPVSKLESRHRDFRWLEFRRSRKGESSQIGYGFSLVFPEPVAGPIALGYGAHFGLGLFVPESP